MSNSIDTLQLADAAAVLREANLLFAKNHPGEGAGRQPVHTVYGGAHLFAFDTVAKLGGLALRALDRFAPDASLLGHALGIAEHPSILAIDERVRDKVAATASHFVRADMASLTRIRIRPGDAVEPSSAN